MAKKKYSPAEWVIMQFGGIRPLAREAGRSPSAIWLWKRSGTVPTGVQARILTRAKAKGYDVTAEDIVRGR